MVSNIKYYSFKDLNYFARKPFTSLVMIILVLVVIIAEPQIMIFTFTVGYSLSGPLWGLYRLRYKQAVSGEEEVDEGIQEKS